MKKKKDLIKYVKKCGIEKKSIETLIDNIETDEKGNISNSDFKDYCFIIDCIIISELIKSLPD